MKIKYTIKKRPEWGLRITLKDKSSFIYCEEFDGPLVVYIDMASKGEAFIEPHLPLNERKLNSTTTSTTTYFPKSISSPFTYNPTYIEVQQKRQVEIMRIKRQQRDPFKR